MEPWHDYRRTNHVLGFLATVLSGGLMGPVWLAVTISNNRYNKKLYEMRLRARDYAQSR